MYYAVKTYIFYDVTLWPMLKMASAMTSYHSRCHFPYRGIEKGPPTWRGTEEECQQPGGANVGGKRKRDHLGVYYAVTKIGRGYSRLDLIATLMEVGSEEIATITDSYTKCYHCVEKFKLRAAENGTEDYMGVDGKAIVGCTVYDVVEYRGTRFIFGNGPDMGISSLHARLKFQGWDGKKRSVDATAVRMYGIKNTTQVIRFMHSISVPLDDYFALWISDPAAESEPQNQLLLELDRFGQAFMSSSDYPKRSRGLLNVFYGNCCIVTVFRLTIHWFLM